VDRSLTGYEGLIAAQECIPNNDLRDAFAAEFSVLARIGFCSFWSAPLKSKCSAPHSINQQTLERLKNLHLLGVT
jgi:hypothetical protein